MRYKGKDTPKMGRVQNCPDMFWQFLRALCKIMITVTFTIMVTFVAGQWPLVTVTVTVTVTECFVYMWLNETHLFESQGWKEVGDEKQKNEIFCGLAVPSQRALRQCGELRFHLLCSYKRYLNSDGKNTNNFVYCSAVLIIWQRKANYVTGLNTYISVYG